VVKRPLPRRGDVWITDLEPTVGREIRKARPCLVVSPDAMNRFLRTYTVMPLTSGSRAAPFRIPTRFAGKDGFLLAEQLRTADLVRLKVKIGEIDKETLKRALAVLRDMFEE
jgi:mRNA interferase MazF